VLHTSPEWLDASHLLLVVAEGGARDIVVLRLGPDGRPVGEPGRLTSGLQVHSVSAWPGAGRIAYSVFSRTANLWAVPLPSGSGPARLQDARPLTSGSQVIEAADVSPDGRWLAFDNDRRGNQDIYRMPVEGGEPEPVVTRPVDDFRPAWSPDGRELAFYSFEQGVRRLFVVPSRGGVPRMVRPEDSAEEHSPDWSPDGRRLVFHRLVDSVRQLFVVERQSGERWGAARQVSRLGCHQGRWSPDGRWIACTSAGDVKLVAADGSETRVLLAPADAPAGALPFYLRWSRDGRELLYSAYEPNGAMSIWALPAAGGRPRLLLRFDDAQRAAARPEFATDGRRLYFTLAQSESDVWTVELTR
jgi:Tol biopolymer transport system component